MLDFFYFVLLMCVLYICKHVYNYVLCILLNVHVKMLLVLLHKFFLTESVLDFSIL